MISLSPNPLGAWVNPPVALTYYAVANGWAIDPEAVSGPIDVRVDFIAYDPYGDANWWDSVTVTANVYSSDPALQCLGLGSRHGFYVEDGPVDGALSHEALSCQRYSPVDAW